MELGLMAGDEPRQMTVDRINSRDWWIILVTNGPAGDLIQRIEDKYYADEETSPGFEILFTISLGIGILAIAFALKKHMTGQQLSALIDQMDTGDVKVPMPGENQDIIIPIINNNPSFALSFCQWLEGPAKQN